MSTEPKACSLPIFSRWMIAVLIVFAICEVLFFSWGGEAIVWALGGLFSAFVFGLLRRSRVREDESFLGSVAMVIVIVCIFAFLFLPAVQVSREAGRRAVCISNLKNLGLALQNHDSSKKRFPAAFVADESGRPMHSWRTFLLPYLDRMDVFEAYDFEKPWDSPENRAIADKVGSVDVLQCPGASVSDDQPKARTDYVAVLGDDTMWPTDGTTRTLDDISDSYRVAMLIDINHSDIPWNEPRDVLLDDFLTGKRSWTGTGIHPHGGNVFYDHDHCRGHCVLMASGQVYFIGPDLTPEQLRRLFSVTNPLSEEEIDSLDSIPDSRPIVFRHVVFYIWLATLLIQFLYVFSPLPEKT